MELLETQDPEKKKLITTSERHQRALEKELNALSIKKDRILTNALIIGGSLALTYLVVNSMTKKARKKKSLEPAANGNVVGSAKEEEESDEPSVLAQYSIRILSQFSTIILDFARAKLSEYLESRKRNNEHS